MATQGNDFYEQLSGSGLLNAAIEESRRSGKQFVDTLNTVVPAVRRYVEAQHLSPEEKAKFWTAFRKDIASKYIYQKPKPKINLYTLLHGPNVTQYHLPLVVGALYQNFKDALYNFLDTVGLYHRGYSGWHPSVRPEQPDSHQLLQRYIGIVDRVKGQAASNKTKQVASNAKQAPSRDATIADLLDITPNKPTTTAGGMLASNKTKQVASNAKQAPSRDATIADLRGAALNKPPLVARRAPAFIKAKQVASSTKQAPPKKGMERKRPVLVDLQSRIVPTTRRA